MSFKTPEGKELKIIKLKGKDYLPVAERILWFREVHPDWAIYTEIKFSDESYSQVRAEIVDPTGRIIATAHKSETAKGFPDHMEKAETGAIGRALALCGYGTQFVSDEFDEKERLADSPRITASENFGPPPPAEVISDPSQYTPKFGKFQGRAMYTLTPHEIENYIMFLEGPKTKKPLSSNALEWIKYATLHLNNLPIDSQDDLPKDWK